MRGPRLPGRVDAVRPASQDAGPVPRTIAPALATSHPAFASWLNRLAALAVFLAAWEVLAIVAGQATLPDPLTVLVTFVRALPRGLGWHTMVSGYRVVLATVLSVVVAAPLGLALGQSPRWDRLVAPLVYLSYPIPKIVLLPILLIFLGLGDASKISMIFLILFFQVLMVVRDASQSVRPELVHSVRSLGARRRQLLRYVYFPACLPAILTSLRVSVGTAIAVLFFVESFGTTAGLGYYIIVESWGRLAYAQMYAGVVAMSLLGVGLYIVLDVLQKRFCGWVDVGRL
ncbi:MAG: ABC transporter permease [Bacteroidetes bacterium]|nr:ABC transporter permease [Bacteroidota bacterium]MCL5025872.1 ABC transporter permease [Chloroflexota bacterium]